jgi:hypothetical protein
MVVLSVPFIEEFEILLEFNKEISVELLPIVVFIEELMSIILELLSHPEEFIVKLLPLSDEFPEELMFEALDVVFIMDVVFPGELLLEVFRVFIIKDPEEELSVKLLPLLIIFPEELALELLELFPIFIMDSDDELSVKLLALSEELLLELLELLPISDELSVKLLPLSLLLPEELLFEVSTA